MKVLILFGCALALLISSANMQDSNPARAVRINAGVPDKLRGTWKLRVENLQHQVITTLTVHFSAKKANSCLGGNWKQIIVDSPTTSDKRFFPIDQALSYEQDKNRLTIGRNEICDAYLQLSGELVGSKASGEYVGFGWHSKPLGYFSLLRDGK